MTGVEVALAVAGAAASAYGVYSSNQAIAASNRAAAQAADYNAAVAAQNADIARRNAGAAEDAQRRQSRAFLARQRAAAAESGFDSTSGSLGLVQEQSADLAELDAQMIRYQGELQARGYTSQAALDRFTGESQRANATRANQAAIIGAGASLLTSSSTISRNYGFGGTKSTRVNGGGGT